MKQNTIIEAAVQSERGTPAVWRRFCGAKSVRAEAEAAASRYPRDAPTVWASGGGESKICYGMPAGGDALKFRFGRGDPVYQKLVSTQARARRWS